VPDVDVDVRVARGEGGRVDRAVRAAQRLELAQSVVVVAIERTPRLVVPPAPVPTRVVAVAEQLARVPTRRRVRHTRVPVQK
jgi:hypothetical protein